MRTIIAGSRGVTSPDAVEMAVWSAGFPITVVLSGTARGVDRLGENWARLHSIQIERYPADWNAYGRSAGYRRNEEMASRADALIAIWDGASPGTGHMIDIARRRGLRVYVEQVAPASSPCQPPSGGSTASDT